MPLAEDEHSCDFPGYEMITGIYPISVIPDIGHRESIFVCFRMDTRYPPASMMDVAIWFTPEASRLLSFHVCRVTAADGLTRPTQLRDLG